MFGIPQPVDQISLIVIILFILYLMCYCFNKRSFEKKKLGEKNEDIKITRQIPKKEVLIPIQPQEYQEYSNELELKKNIIDNLAGDENNDTIYDAILIENGVSIINSNEFNEMNTTNIPCNNNETKIDVAGIYQAEPVQKDWEEEEYFSNNNNNDNDNKNPELLNNNTGLVNTVEAGPSTTSINYMNHVEFLPCYNDIVNEIKNDRQTNSYISNISNSEINNKSNNK